MSQQYIKTQTKARSNDLADVCTLHTSSNTYCIYLVRASLSQTRVSRRPIISQAADSENSPWVFFTHFSTIEEVRRCRRRGEKKGDTKGETERNENVGEGPRSIHGGVRGRALSTYLPNALRRLLGPPTTFTTG